LEENELKRQYQEGERFIVETQLPMKGFMAPILEEFRLLYSGESEEEENMECWGSLVG